MPGNFVELPGILGRRRGDLNPIQLDLICTHPAAPIKGSRPIRAGLSKPQKPPDWGLFDSKSPQWGDVSLVDPFTLPAVGSHPPYLPFLIPPDVILARLHPFPQHVRLGDRYSPPVHGADLHERAGLQARHGAGCACEGAVYRGPSSHRLQRLHAVHVKCENKPHPPTQCQGWGLFCVLGSMSRVVVT